MSSSSSKCQILVSILAVLAFARISQGLNTVVYGPQAREMLLLTAKQAAKAGIDTSYVCASGSETSCRRLMYGSAYAQAETDEAGNAKPVSLGGDIQTALENANSLILVAYDNPIEESALKTLLSATSEDNLSKIVLLSKMGITKAKGGFFGGGDAKLLDSEKMIRKVCESKDGLTVSIIRAGNLKGGGSGEASEDVGLDKCFYSTIFDSVEASVTIAHDKYTLGIDLTKGDAIEIPNILTQMGTKASFDPCPYDTNRAVVTSATVAAALYEKPLEFSVSAEKGEALPTNGEWRTILEQL